MADEAEVKLPQCPHCNAEMPGVNLFNWAFPPWLIMEVHCPACSKSLHFQIVPINLAEQQRQPPPTGRPSLIKPS